MEERYHLEQLDHTAKEIRLVKLLHADQGTSDPLYRPRCIIKHVNLDSKPEYQALSYTWGSPSITSNIYIESKLFTIRLNLWEFLRQKAQDQEFCDDAKNWLWIDQICINQEDAQERNHQVGQMSLVYRQARKVLIWLGTGTKDTDRAMGIIGADTSVWDAERVVPAASGSRDPHLEVIAGLGYWNRLWIIQEVILARKVMVFCGAKQIHWHDLKSFARYHEEREETKDRMGFGKRKHVRSKSGLYTLMSLELKDSMGKSTWRHALEMSREAQCEEPRDRIYGMLGLLEPTSVILADYSCTVEDLFWSVLNIELQTDIYDYDWREYWRRRLDSSGRSNVRESRDFCKNLVSNLASALRLSLSLRTRFKIQKMLAMERFKIEMVLVMEMILPVAEFFIFEDWHKMLRAEWRHMRRKSQ